MFYYLRISRDPKPKKILDVSIFHLKRLGFLLVYSQLLSYKTFPKVSNALTIYKYLITDYLPAIPWLCPSASCYSWVHGSCSSLSSWFPWFSLHVTSKHVSLISNLLAYILLYSCHGFYQGEKAVQAAAFELCREKKMLNWFNCK